MEKFSHTFPFLPQPGIRAQAKIDPAILKNAQFYPLIPIQLYYKSTNIIIEALVDSGADKIVLPNWVAINLKIHILYKEECSGIGGNAYHYQLEVGMKIGRAGKISDLGIIPTYFSDRDDMPVLLGRVPLFDEYKIIFEKYNNKIQLIPKESEISGSKKSRSIKTEKKIGNSGYKFKNKF